MVIPLTKLTDVFFLNFFFLQSPLHLVGTQQPMAPLQVQYKCWEWKLCSTDLSLPAQAGRMDHWAASKTTSSDSFSACRVLDFSFQCCTLCCAKPVQSYLCFPLTAHLPVLQSKLSCCIHNLWASYSLTLQIWYTKLASQTFRAKSCSVWKSVWKLCQNQQRSSSLGPGHCFLQGASNQAKLVPHAKKSQW